MKQRPSGLGTTRLPRAHIRLSARRTRQANRLPFDRRILASVFAEPLVSTSGSATRGGELPRCDHLRGEDFGSASPDPFYRALSQPDINESYLALWAARGQWMNTPENRARSSRLAGSAAPRRSRNLRCWPTAANCWSSFFQPHHRAMTTGSSPGLIESRNSDGVFGRLLKDAGHTTAHLWFRAIGFRPSRSRAVTPLPIRE